MSNCWITTRKRFGCRCRVSGVGVKGGGAPATDGCREGCSLPPPYLPPMREGSLFRGRGGASEENQRQSRGQKQCQRPSTPASRCSHVCSPHRACLLTAAGAGRGLPGERAAQGKRRQSDPAPGLGRLSTGRPCTSQAGAPLGALAVLPADTRSSKSGQNGGGSEGETVGARGVIRELLSLYVPDKAPETIDILTAARSRRSRGDLAGPRRLLRLLELMGCSYFF